MQGADCRQPGCDVMQEELLPPPHCPPPPPLAALLLLLPPPVPAAARQIILNHHGCARAHCARTETNTHTHTHTRSGSEVCTRRAPQRRPAVSLSHQVLTAQRLAAFRAEREIA